MVKLEQRWIDNAIKYPFNPLGLVPPGQDCTHTVYNGKVILTIDIDDTSVEVYGGPVWHLSISPKGSMRFQDMADLLVTNNLGKGPCLAIQVMKWSDQIVRLLTESEFELIKDKIREAEYDDVQTVCSSQRESTYS